MWVKGRRANPGPGELANTLDRGVGTAPESATPHERSCLSPHSVRQFMSGPRACGVHTCMCGMCDTCDMCSMLHLHLIYFLFIFKLLLGAKLVSKSWVTPETINHGEASAAVTDSEAHSQSWQAMGAVLSGTSVQLSSPFLTGEAGDFRAAPERPEVDPAQQFLLPAAGRADTWIQWYDPPPLRTHICEGEPPSPVGVLSMF